MSSQHIDKATQMIIEAGGNAESARTFFETIPGRVILRKIERHASVSFGFGESGASMLLLLELYDTYNNFEITQVMNSSTQVGQGTDNDMLASDDNEDRDNNALHGSNRGIAEELFHETIQHSESFDTNLALAMSMDVLLNDNTTTDVGATIAHTHVPSISFVEDDFDNLDGIPQTTPHCTTGDTNGCTPNQAVPDMDLLLTENGISVDTGHVSSEVTTLCSICFVDPSELQCDGTSPHFFCLDCFNHYAISSFKVGGTFAARITSNDIVSQPGQLSCPFFLNSECNCNSIPPTTLGLCLSPDAYLQKDHAIQKMEEDRRVAEKITNEVESSMKNSLETLFQAVQDVMVVGASVACPHCGYRGEKDGACMHITCENVECRRPWCYCCGRSRSIESEIRCQTCDRSSAYLQNFPGWNNFVCEEGESPGYAALHEFHRRRIAYFLRCCINEVPDAPWNELWTSFPDLLIGVPTPCRILTLEDIRNVEPPVFAPTELEDVAWLRDAHPIIDQLKASLARIKADVVGSQSRSERDGHCSGGGVRHRRRRWWNLKGWLHAAKHHRHDSTLEEAQVDQGGTSLQELLDEIIDNDTLDEDIREVMIESLLTYYNSA